MQMRDFDDPKHSNSFELVAIDDNDNNLGVSSTYSAPPSSSSLQTPLPFESERKSGCRSAFHLTPRGRLFALASYLLITGMSSLYFCLVLAGLQDIKLCDSVASCMFYSSQGWPALGEQTIDLLIMSYISGTISVLGGVLGAFGVYAAIRKSPSIVKLFARAWWFMIGIFIVCTLLTLVLTVVHKELFLTQCGIEHDTALGLDECGPMYLAALLGSMIGCLVGVTMIWCYGEDVVKYSIQLEAAKDKERNINSDL